MWLFFCVLHRSCLDFTCMWGWLWMVDYSGNFFYHVCQHCSCHRNIFIYKICNWWQFREYISFPCSSSYFIEESWSTKFQILSRPHTFWKCFSSYDKDLFLKHSHSFVSVLLGCGATSMGNGSLHQDNVMVPSAMIKVSKKKFAHFYPSRWDHYITSNCQEPISQWYGAMTQMNRDLNCTTTKA